MRKILAVDFDDTLFAEENYPFPGSPIWKNISYVKKRRADGWLIILTTLRHTPENLQIAIDAARSVGIEFDYINENAPERIALWGDSRKIACDELLDDKSIFIWDSETEILPKGGRLCSEDIQ